MSSLIIEAFKRTMAFLRRNAASFAVLLILAFVWTALDAPGKETFSAKRSVVIDPGHGGFDGGALGRATKAREDDINLDVSLKLYEELRSAGFLPILTRENEKALADTKRADMERRRQIIKSSEPDIVVSVHMNANPDSRASGPQVYYMEGSEEGERLARLIQAALNDEVKPSRPRHHVAESSYFILKSGSAPCVIVECGFLSNPGEEALLLKEEYRARLATAIAWGITDYFTNFNE
ncbi:MAG: N-acetylmuramoyl-L-alanine amidase [Christensenellales bacterium]